MKSQYSRGLVHLATKRIKAGGAVWAIACGQGTTATVKASRLAHRVTCEKCHRTTAFDHAPVAGILDLPGVV